MARRCGMIGLVLAAGVAWPAVAGGPDASADPSSPPPLVLQPPPPLADIPPPKDAPPPCLPALPCGTRLYGASQKNGTLGVTEPVLHW